MCYISKCLKDDPERRIKLAPSHPLVVRQSTCLALLMHLKKKLQGRRHLPPSLFLGELWGGVVGLFGGYSRSLRRVEEIRKRFP